MYTCLLITLIERCVNWNQYYTKCTTGPTNPFNGAISFDNIGLAWVAIFLVISLEGWTDVMYFVQVLFVKIMPSKTDVAPQCYKCMGWVGLDTG